MIILREIKKKKKSYDVEFHLDDSCMTGFHATVMKGSCDEVPGDGCRVGYSSGGC
jgi:hypothetical protein